MSFGKTKATKSVSVPVFKETWLPGQKEYIPEFANIWKDIFAGNLESPTAKMLQQITGEAAMRETAQQRRSIAGTKGMTAPAKAKAMSTLGGTAVSAMAKVPQDIWGAAKEFLSAYTLAPPTVTSGTAGKTSGGGGWQAGICSCQNLRAVNEGVLIEDLQRFRDEHFSQDGDIAFGYYSMGLWFVPLVKRSKVIKQLGRIFFYHPLVKYTEFHYDKNHYGVIFFWVAKFWEIFWKLTGKKERKRYGLSSN